MVRWHDGATLRLAFRSFLLGRGPAGLAKYVATLKKTCHGSSGLAMTVRLSRARTVVIQRPRIETLSSVFSIAVSGKGLWKIILFTPYPYGIPTEIHRRLRTNSWRQSPRKMNSEARYEVMMISRTKNFSQKRSERWEATDVGSDELLRYGEREWWSPY